MIIHNGTSAGASQVASGGDRLTQNGGAPSSRRFVCVLAALAVLGLAADIFLARRKGTDSQDAGRQNEGTDSPVPSPPLSFPAPPSPSPAASCADPTLGTDSPATAPLPARAAGSVPSAGSQDAESVPSGKAQDDESVPAATPPFATETEQLISWLESIPPGEDVPPLPIDLDDDLEADADAAAATPIVIGEDESEESAARKEGVGWTKADLQKARGEGWTTAEYLKAMEAQKNEDAAFLRERRREFREILADRSLTDEQCLAELDRINAELAERGLPEIKAKYE